MGMQAVGRAAGAIVVRVRRQLPRNRGAWRQGKARLRSRVDIDQRRQIREMIVQCVAVCGADHFLYAVSRRSAGRAPAFSALGAMLLGTIVTRAVRRRSRRTRAAAPGNNDKK